MNKSHKISESLIEIIVSISIIGVGAVAALTIISMSVRGNIASKDRLVAINLAREGIEVFENIRDTNVKNAAYESEPKCWRAIDIDECSPTSLNALFGKSDNGPYVDYIVMLDPDNMGWTILEANGLIDANITTSGPSDEFRIYKYNINTEDTVLTNLPSSSATDFYRAVRVQEIKKEDLTINNFEINTYFTQGDLLKITSIVYFKNRNVWSKAEISTVLANVVD